MLIKHHITTALPLKGKLHVPDVLGIRVAHLLSPGALLACTFQSPNGEQFEAQGKIAFELINYKGRGENLDKMGGSLIFDGFQRQPHRSDGTCSSWCQMSSNLLTNRTASALRAPAAGYRTR